MDCIVHGVAKSQTQLSNFHFTSLSPGAWPGWDTETMELPGPHPTLSPGYLPASLCLEPLLFGKSQGYVEPQRQSQSMWAFRPLLRNKATVIAGRLARRGHTVSGAPGGPQAGTQVHWAAYLQTVGQVQAGRRVHTAAFTP